MHTADISYTPSHYNPHKEVIKEDRETTKIRIVNDCNAKRKGQCSLNDYLETGDCLLPKLFDVIIRYRAYEIAITSDIKSAFLMIGIQPEDRDFLRFLWVDDISKDDPCVIIKRYARLLFGLNCAPHILVAIIFAHMKKYLDINEQYVMQFLLDLYMDDNISGAQNLQSAIDYYLFIKVFILEG